MLRDRFSGSSTPSGSPPPRDRTYSPAPRTSSRLAAPPQRPVISRQSSIVSLVSGSSVSLPGTAKVPNGSPLKRSTEPKENVPDPLKILRTVLGEPESPDHGDSGENDELDSSTPSLDLVVDFGAFSLQQFANSHIEGGDSPKSAPFLLSTQLYSEEHKKYEGFHNAISGCGSVLQSVESYLSNFQDELGAVSAEIETLQSRSVQLNARLENRRKVESLLRPAVEEISISPMTIRTIVEGPVDDNWIKALRELEARSDQVARKSVHTNTTKVLEDLRPLLNDLKAKAVERIRDFYVTQIKAIRSPDINAQAIQQGTMIRYKELYAFLSRNHKVLADEIAQAYVNTMKWYYNNYFTQYREALEKLRILVADQGDVVGADPAVQKKTTLSSTKAQVSGHDFFDIGRRADILRLDTISAIPSHLAEDSKSLHYLEVPFHNFNVAVIDNVSFEYSIVAELFAGNRSFHDITRLVDTIFSSTFHIGRSLTKSLVNSSTDCLGIFLCVRLNQRSAFMLQRRKIPVAESYINGTNLLLWPRFQQILDLHNESLKRATTSTTRFTANTALSLVGGLDSSNNSVAPHIISQRFGQFLHGVLVLSAEVGDDEPVTLSIGRLRNEYEALMVKLSKNVGDTKRRERFLFNNFSLVLAIVGDCQGNLAEKQKEHLQQQLDTKRQRR